MPETMFSQRAAATLDIVGPVYRFFADSAYSRRAGDPAICDFVAGNPHDMPLPGFVEALGRWHVPRNKDWFAYKLNEQPAREVVARSLTSWRGQPFEPEDIFLTNGAFAALSVALYTLVNPGDEVIFISPPWFFYEGLITAYGGKPVRVKIDPASFDLDLNAIAAAISDRTRAIIINSPNNPTGKIYPPETLEQLARLLSWANERQSRPIYLLSDEAYSRIIYDDRRFHSPTSFYPHSLLLYTYGKTLLTPGQRIGYIALPPSMPEREQLRPAINVAQLMCGFAFPNALLQHAIGDLDQLSIDIGQLQRRRDRLVAALTEIGYELHSPEGTFYLLPCSPLEDDMAFIDLLAEQDIFCLPGSVTEMPGYFRISITANDAMVERSISGFAAAFERARQRG